MDIVGQNWRVEYVDVENFGSYHYLLFFFSWVKAFFMHTAASQNKLASQFTPLFGRSSARHTKG
jgi:hypothetical protein